MRPLRCVLGAHDEIEQTVRVWTPGAGFVRHQVKVCARCGWEFRGIGQAARWQPPKN